MHTGLIKKGITTHMYNNRTQMGAGAAKAAADTIRQLLSAWDEVNMVFAAAPSQNEFLSALIKENVDWRRINAFHMDEYIGLPAGSTATFGYYLQEHLFGKVSFKTIHYINGNAVNIAEECERYTKLLQTHPIDIVCMGIGENSHIAFNDPPVANFNDTETVKVVTLDEACRRQQVNDGCFPSLNEVPTHALTLTVPALLNCRYIFCIVPGERKAQAVFHTFNSEIGEQYPSTALRTHGSVQLFLDKDSAGLVDWLNG
jgi:glucosamine-6-phosphate deaminase